MDDWTAAVCADLGLDTSAADFRAVLDLTRDVAHGVARPAAPLTAYLVGVAVGVAPQVLGFLLGPRRPDQAKNSPYECGFEAFEDARMKFDVRYYLVAILFILFDLETVFLRLIDQKEVAA